MEAPDRTSYAALIALARQEDLGAGDLTSELTIPADRVGQGRLVFRQAGVLCGLAAATEVLRCYDERLRLETGRADGQPVAAGDTVAVASGPLRSLLSAERVVLNFLQRLSGIATLTSRFVAAVAGTEARIYDTRKTTPGWRALEKYAVRCGGGCNHRQGLYDAVLIKDNHLASLGRGDPAAGLGEAVAKLRQRGWPCAFVAVEVDGLEQLPAVLAVEGVDIVLLDNMTCEQLRQAVALRDAGGRKGSVQLEASGAITLATVRAVAETGVERISAGALTHSAAWLDVGLDLD